jgi:hypothetical protein
VLLWHPAVGQVALIGLADAQIVEWAKGQLAADKYPRRVILLRRIAPRSLGKVLEPELVAAYAPAS